MKPDVRFGPSPGSHLGKELQSFRGVGEGHLCRILPCSSTHSCFTLKETLLAPEVAFAPGKKDVDLKLCLVGSPGGAADLVGRESGGVHEADDFGKERRAVVEGK